MISTARYLAAAELRLLTGWELKPEGLCRDDICVPFENSDPDRVDLQAVADHLRRPLLHEETHGLWALGPESGGHFLENARFPDLVLPDLDGIPFSFSSLLGRKVVMVAWASW